MRDDNDTDRPATSPRVTPLRNLRGYRIADGAPDVRGWEIVGGDGKRIGSVNDFLVDSVEGKVRYLDVQLDTGLYRAGGESNPQDQRPSPAADAAPGLDPLASGMAVSGMASVPGAVITPSLVGAATVTEYLVRETLSDEENRLTADHHLDSRHHTGERHVVFPVGQTEIDEEADRVLVPSLKAADAVNLPPYVPGEISPDYEQSLRRWFDPSFTPSPDRDLYAGDLYDQERFYRRRRAAAQRVR
jgi:hypothetical protein